MDDDDEIVFLGSEYGDLRPVKRIKTEDGSPAPLSHALEQHAPTSPRPTRSSSSSMPSQRRSTPISDKEISDMTLSSISIIEEDVTLTDDDATALGSSLGKSACRATVNQDSSRRQPQIAFANAGLVPLNQDLFVATDNVLGECYKLNTELRCFRTERDVSAILSRLEDEDLLDTFASAAGPQCFQGSAAFVVKCRSAEQRTRIFALLAQDNNGWWHEGSTTSAPFFSVTGEELWYTCKNYYSRPNKQANGFKRRIFGIVGEKSSSVTTADFAVVQYSWNKDEPEVFTPGRQSSSRALTEAMRQLAEPMARGKSKTPREVFLKQNSSISQDDLSINPFCGPKGIRQATNCKTSANRKVFHKDPEEHLRLLPGVFVRQFEDSTGKKQTNYILSNPYQIGLIAESCKSKHKAVKQIDLTYNLANFHVVTICIPHPFVQNHKNGTPSLVLGPVMFTQSLCTESYTVLADYIHGALRDLGIDMEAGDFSFDFVTDGEVALYRGFMRAFKHSRHTLCVRHIRGNIERALTKVSSISQKKKRYIVGRMLGTFEGAGDGRQYVHALIDAPSEIDYLTKWAQLVAELDLPQFTDWWEKHHQRDFIEKLLQPNRDSMGYCQDLPHTNYVEALNKMLKALCGKHQDVRLLAEKILTIFADEIVFLFEALKSRGQKHRLKAEYLEKFSLEKEKATDPRHIQEKVQLMFPHCNADAITVYAQNGQVQKLALEAARTDALNAGRQELPTTSANALAMDAEPALLPLPSFGSTNLPKMFQGSWHRAMQIRKASISKLTLDEARKIPKLNGPVERVKVRSQTKETSVYFVEISSVTGRGLCSCYQHSEARDPACKHIIAAAWYKGKLDKLILWLGKEQNQKPFGPGATRASGGWKPNQGPRRKSGTGYTKRTGHPAKFGAQPPADGNTAAKRVWERSKAPFIIKKKEHFEIGTQCPGCILPFAEKPCNLDLCVAHNEEDVMAGTTQVAPARDRYYHLSLQCITWRHTKFDIHTPGRVMDDSTTLVGLNEDQRNLIARFRQGELY